MSLASFFQNLLNLFTSNMIVIGTIALVVTGIAAAFHAIRWTTFFSVLFALAVAFAASSIVSQIYA